MRRQREHQPHVAVTRKHRWAVCSPMAVRAGRIERCEDCGIVRGVGCWYDRYGEAHTTSVPRCG